MKKFLGTFSLGYENVDLRVDSDLSGGTFCLNPRANTKPVITVGFQYSYWSEVFNVLCHEAFEMALARILVRYTGSERWAPSTSEYVFHFDHEQFTEACGMASHFVDAAQNLIRKEWNKHLKRSKRKKKL